MKAPAVNSGSFFLIRIGTGGRKGSSYILPTFGWLILRANLSSLLNLSTVSLTEAISGRMS